MRHRRLVLPRLHQVPGARTKIVDSTTPALSAGDLVVKSRRRQLAATHDTTEAISLVPPFAPVEPATP